MFTSLFLSSFRWYREKHISLWAHTLITWVNGSGKTHLLEALHWCSWGSLSPNLRWEFECVSLSGVSKETPFQAFIVRKEGKSTLSFQGQKLSRQKYLDIFPMRTVMFSPLDMNLTYLAPPLRREYMDSILDRAFGQFGKTKREYDHVLRQRNALLKNIREGSASPQDLDFWDEKFATLAELYLLYRYRYIDAVREGRDEVTRFFPSYSLSFEYITKVGKDDPKNAILEYLHEKRERDIITWHTYIGPHLDDFQWYITFWSEKYSVSEYLSRWENKAVLLGMKHIEVRFLENYTWKEICLLFDDLFSELDQNYANAVIERLSHYQLCITAQYLPSWRILVDDFICIDTENL